MGKDNLAPESGVRVLRNKFTRFTWHVGMMSRSSTSRPGNIASASDLCRFGHVCTEYSIPQTVVVTGSSIAFGL